MEEQVETRFFTQAEVDDIVTKRLDRERRKNRQSGGFGDEGAANSQSLEAENCELKNMLLLAKRGAPASQLEYHAFYISREFGEEPFDQAVDKYLAVNPDAFTPRDTIRVDFGAGPGYPATVEGRNDQMNALIRGAMKGV